MREFKNSLTGKIIVQEDPKDSAMPYDGKMMIIEMDRDGAITYTNRKFRDMTGYSREEIVGVSFDISKHPDMPDGICQQAFEVASSGQIWAGYIKSITKSGEFFWSAICVQPKFDIEKDLVGYIINKKPVSDEILQGVEAEYEKFGISGSPIFKSEYCGVLHNSQTG